MFFWWCNFVAECSQLLEVIVCTVWEKDWQFSPDISMHVPSREHSKFTNNQPDSFGFHLRHILLFVTSFRILNLWPLVVGASWVRAHAKYRAHIFHIIADGQFLLLLHRAHGLLTTLTKDYIVCRCNRYSIAFIVFAPPHFFPWRREKKKKRWTTSTQKTESIGGGKKNRTDGHLITFNSVDYIHPAR